MLQGQFNSKCKPSSPSNIDLANANTTLYCQANKLSRQAIIQIFKKPNTSKLSFLPPVHPKEGDVFLYSDSFSSSLSKDILCDGIAWKSTGVKSHPSSSPQMHIRYYSLRHGHGFYRRVYSTTEQKTAWLLLLR